MTIEDTMANPKLLPPCDDCGRATRWRNGPAGAFIACTGFPKCRWSRSKAALARQLEKRAVASSVAAARAKKARRP